MSEEREADSTAHEEQREWFTLESDTHLSNDDTVSTQATVNSNKRSNDNTSDTIPQDSGMLETNKTGDTEQSLISVESRLTGKNQSDDIEDKGRQDSVSELDRISPVEGKKGPWYALKESKSSIKIPVDKNITSSKPTGKRFISTSLGNSDDSTLEISEHANASDSKLIAGLQKADDVGETSDSSHINDSARLEEGRFAAMQRPEPLGKAWADNHIALVSLQKTKSDYNILEEKDLLSRVSPTEDSDEVVESSDDGLKEQQYPTRIPLSESYNHRNTSQIARGADLVADEQSLELSSKIAERKIRPDQNAVSGSLNDTAEDVVINEDKPGSNPQLKSLLENQAKGPMSDSNHNSPVSTLLEPTYQSSVALLKELQKRRLKSQYDTKSIGNQEYSGPADPLRLAENAMKASNILSNRTEKSLKRASKVLKAVEEHRSPPVDSFDNSSTYTSNTQSSLSSKLEGLSVSAHTSENIIEEETESSKDSIDKLIDLRMKKGGSRLASSKTSSISDDSTPLNSHMKPSLQSTEKHARSTSSSHNSGKSFGGSSSIINHSSSHKPFGRVSYGHSDNETITSHVPIASIRSSLNDATSSELLMLESMENEVDSPTSQSIAAKFQSKVDEISPIEKRNDNQNAVDMKFRASSRIRNGRGYLLQKEHSLTDSEIVKLHRSLGAGTVTPLPLSAEHSPEKHDHEDTWNVSRSRGSGPSFKGGKNYTDEERASISPFISLRSGSQGSVKPKDKAEKDNVPVNGDVQRPNKQDELNGDRAMNKMIERKNRGIYDVRDSTGPGSNNRRRIFAGRQPIRSGSPTKDPTMIYVSEESKTDISVGPPKVENGTYEQKGDTVTRSLMTDNVNGSVGKDSHSSMLSDFPVLSLNENSSSEALGPDKTPGYDKEQENDSRSSYQYTDILEESRKEREFAIDNVSRKKTQRSGDRGKGDHRKRQNSISSSSSSNLPVSRFLQETKNDFKSSPGTGETSFIRKRELNQLWEKFKKNFNLVNEMRRQDMMKKVDIFNDLLTEQDITQSVTLVNKGKARLTEKSTAKQDSQISEDETKKDKDLLLQTKPIDSKPNGKSNCPLCGTHSETSYPKEPLIKKHDGDKNDPPLLLHTWTQTAPNINFSIQLENPSNLKPTLQKERQLPSKQKGSKTHFRPMNADKENINVSVDFPNGKSVNQPKSELFGPNTKSWDVMIENIPKKEGKGKGIPKDDLQEPIRKKRKDPVFTAWFQSTRSDTSSGTVVPLSSVPKLADTYKETKRTHMIIVEEPSTKETASIVRVGLQEAFRFAKSDFIQRSRLRIEHVKNARNRVKRKRNIKDLQERRLEEAVLNNEGKQNPQPAVEHLFKPRKRMISKREMIQQNKKMYDKLPEVVKRREEEQRKAQYQRNQILMKQFDKKLRTKLLKNQGR